MNNPGNVSIIKKVTKSKKIEPYTIFCYSEKRKNSKKFLLEEAR